jgi:small ligand-binding sensory domain FIST
VAGFRFAHAGAADWREAAQSCFSQLGAGAGNLGFLYVTDMLADQLAPILAAFRENTGVEHWVGTVGIGVCATGREYLDEPAMAVMIGEFEPGSFQVFSGVTSEEQADTIPVRCGKSMPHFAVVHADPLNRHVREMVHRLADRMESGFLVGGLSSSRRQNLQIADAVTEGGPT